MSCYMIRNVITYYVITTYYFITFYVITSILKELWVQGIFQRPFHYRNTIALLSLVV